MNLGDGNQPYAVVWLPISEVEHMTRAVGKPGSLVGHFPDTEEFVPDRPKGIDGMEMTLTHVQVKLPVVGLKWAAVES
jgi:hypothetical protein